MTMKDVPVTQGSNAAGFLRDLALKNIAVTGLIALIVASAMLSPYFLTVDNIFNVLRQWSMVGLIAIGLTFVIISGGIDLSGGAIMALATVVGALTAPHLGAFGMVLVVLAIGSLCGFLNGAMITWGRVPPFVATLGMMTAARGMALILSDGRTLPAQLPPEFVFVFGRGYLGPVPMPVLLTAIAFVVAAVALKHTVYGRHVCLVGDNPVGAHRSGIPVDRVVRSVYVLHGVLAAAAGLLFLGRLGVGEPTGGMLFELSAIAAVVIGGTPFAGGVGSVFLTFIGLMVIGLTYNILNLLSVSPYAQDVARGLIIVVAVMFSIRRESKGKARH
ncbi:ABC transporter permease [Bosea sp. PAMC 26642]|uniref:ABC transporter permease n=1 Tax=Bosea sp. (strain PAMC 26642) TaxID=1792307 RepID=UPI000A4A43AD|nr:ABC transporter permease [Bosea sp. PAMC 26642]